MGPLRSLYLAAALLAARALTQTVLDASKLPSCVMNCPTINRANAVCVPPATAASDQATYQNCFCQSAYLTTLYTSPSGICDDVCSADDTQKMMQWYVGLCRSGQVVTPSAVTTTAATNGQATTSTGAASSSSTTAGSGSTGSRSRGSWISTHWKWILLLIVVFASMLGFGWLGIFLRRRHERARDLARANVAATSGSAPATGPAAGSSYRQKPSGPLPTRAGSSLHASSRSFSNASHLNPPRTQDGLPEIRAASPRTAASPTPTRPRPPIMPPAAMVRSAERDRANGGPSPVSPVSPISREKAASPAAHAAALAAVSAKGKGRGSEKAMNEKDIGTSS